MTGESLSPPTLASLKRVLPAYGEYPFDVTLASARIDIGSSPDPGNIEHAKRLRIWLNQWLCRIGYPTTGNDVFAESLAIWWSEAKDSLPDVTRRLAELTDVELLTIAAAYGDLNGRPAAISKSGTCRSVGPTATAKLLYFVRPSAVTAWDKEISIRTGGGSSQGAFLRHLTICRGWAVALEHEGRQLGLEPDQIGPYLDRPASSVAKLIDEWLYATVTGGFGAFSD